MDTITLSALRVVQLSACPFTIRSSTHLTGHRRPRSIRPCRLSDHHPPARLRMTPAHVSKEDTEAASSSTSATYEDPDPQDLEYVSQVKRVLEILRKNRDMLFGEVKLTIMIEDPRDVERRRLLGIDDENAPTREDLAAALEEINEGKVPTNRAALQMLAEEMMSWPKLEVEVPKSKSLSRSLYAKATDTGVDPKKAAKRLNIDWDSAAEIEDVEDTDEPEVPAAVK